MPSRVGDAAVAAQVEIPLKLPWGGCAARCGLEELHNWKNALEPPMIRRKPSGRGHRRRGKARVGGVSLHVKGFYITG